MQSPTFLPLSFTYKKTDSQVWVLNTDDIPIAKELIRDQQIVHFAPNSVGGNHKHPRTEWFVGIGDLVFVWLDELGKKHQKQMYPNDQLLLITVPPFLPHAVVNQSIDHFGILYEMADGKMVDVEKIKLV